MKKTKLYSLIAAAALSTSIFVSCQTEDAQNTNNTQDEFAKVSAKLENLGFNVEHLQQAQMNGAEGYVVEGDIFLTLSQINEMSPKVTVGSDFVSTEHYRTNNLVSTPRVISVYMDSQFNSTMQAAFDDALQRYNDLGLAISFQRASSSGADIDILAQKFKRQPGGYITLGQSAGFPDANGDPASPIILNSDVYNPRGKGSIPADAATVIAHEIGHAIGFRHSDYMDRSFSCGGSYYNEGDAGVGAVYIPGTPSGPATASWMLSCSDGTDRPFTTDDVTALTTLY